MFSSTFPNHQVEGRAEILGKKLGPPVAAANLGYNKYFDKSRTLVHDTTEENSTSAVSLHQLMTSRHKQWNMARSMPAETHVWPHMTGRLS
jgi:hypothetical protein